MEKFKEAFKADIQEVIDQHRSQAWNDAEKDLLEITNDISEVIGELTANKFQVMLTQNPLSDSPESGKDCRMVVHEGSRLLGMLNHYHLKPDGTYPLFFIAPTLGVRKLNPEDLKQKLEKKDERSVNIGLHKLQIENRNMLIAVTVTAFRDPKNEIIRLLASV